MFGNVLTLCCFVSSAAARSPQARPPEALARSLLNVTNYLSDYLEDQGGPAPAPAVAGNPPATWYNGDGSSKEGDGGGPVQPSAGSVAFLPKTGKLICDVKASNDGTGEPKYLHMVVGNLPDAEILGSYAYVMRVDWDATGELDPSAKGWFDSWNLKLGGQLQPALERIPDAINAKEESVANQGKNRVMLGKAKTAPGMSLIHAGTKIIFTGGTSENPDVVPNGGVYFTYVNDAYAAILREAGKSDVGMEAHSLVLAPLAAGKSFNPAYVIDKEVLVFYTGNVLTHHLMNAPTPLNDIYMILPETPANVYAMCKYCQYRSLTPIDELGNGICTSARSQMGSKQGASTVSLLFALLAAAWW